MRSVFINSNDLNFNNELLSYSGDKFRHLTKVIRIRINERIILFNESAETYLCKIEGIDKKSILFKKIKKEIFKPRYFLSIAIGIVKKEAMERCLRNCMELGISKIYLLKTAFSQDYFELKKRHETIIESGMEQSNFFFKPKVEFISNLEDLDFEEYDNKIVLSTEENQKMDKIQRGHDLLLFGPEGGWSEEEIRFFKAKNLVFFQLETPIMRTPSAICAAVGSYLSLSR